MGTSSSTSLGLCLTSNERQQNIITQVGETVVSRCFVGCLGQPRKRCSNRCCCGLRNYASDVRPIDPLAADGESPSQTLAPGVVVFCTATYCVCVCVCVFFPFILDIKFVGRTSRGHTGGRSHRISHPPSFCGACLNFSREKDLAIPFPRRP